MATDKKRLYLISGLLLAALLIAFFVPAGSGRMIAAILLLPGAAVGWVSFKKRPILSIHSKTVLMLISVIGLLYLTLYYMSGLFLGFTRTGYGIRAEIIFKFILPIAAIIAGSELLRHVMCVQHGKAGKVFAYFICLLADMMIRTNIAGLTTFSKFMDMLALSLFPGVLYNLLFNYLTVRYGFLPNIIYRALTIWVFYLIPYGSALSSGIVAMVNLLLPILIYFFIDSLYERKKRYALGRKSLFTRAVNMVLSVLTVVILLGTVMLTSNHFYYGALVIATGSMTGELNKGDVAIFEKYEDQFLQEGQVIVFEEDDNMIIHRIVDIKIINEQTRYFTKGDANDNVDAGWRTDGNIVGLVKLKLPILGLPTLWLRSLFK
jgi:signal peptidase I